MSEENEQPEEKQIPAHIFEVHIFGDLNTKSVGCKINGTAGKLEIAKAVITCGMKILSEVESAEDKPKSAIITPRIIH